MVSTYSEIIILSTILPLLFINIVSRVQYLIGTMNNSFLQILKVIQYIYFNDNTVSFTIQYRPCFPNRY